MTSVIVDDCEYICIGCGRVMIMKDHCWHGQHTDLCRYCKMDRDYARQERSRNADH